VRERDTRADLPITPLSAFHAHSQ